MPNAIAGSQANVIDVRDLVPPQRHAKMSYFAAAIIALIEAQSLMAVLYGFPNVFIEGPKTLILAHVGNWLTEFLDVRRPIWSSSPFSSRGPQRCSNAQINQCR